MGKGTVLYVGGFELPDKNAAAQRVVSIAKILRDIGYNVVFLNQSTYADSTAWKETEYFGFKCFERKKGALVKELFNIDHIKHYIRLLGDVVAVIAYNYPAVALRRLNKYCRQNNIKCIGDITEWYGSKDRSIAYKIIKGSDTFYRMKYQHKKLSGNIVISDYLEAYYRDSTNVVNLPPLVDKREEKWRQCSKTHKGVQLVYAGSPSSEKERLDLIVKAISELGKRYSVSLKVIGVTREQFLEMYRLGNIEIGDTVSFLGRISHQEVIKYVSEADYSILIRDNNRINTAGFPTKFVESISCGTAVIANNSSCIAKYFAEGKNGYLISEKSIKEELESIFEKDAKPDVEADLFDYRKYINELREFMENCNV